MTSLMCPLCLPPYVLSGGSFDRVFHREAVRRATQQSPGGATPRGGSFGRSGGYQELRGEWRMRRADELSSVHQNPGG